jgi:cytochrome c biogenesis protein CcmG/thiol:disulfide interchange protein DsbE
VSSQQEGATLPIMTDTVPTPAFRRRLLIALPLLGFIALAALFFRGLESGDPSRLPSALIGRPAPNLSLPALEGLLRENSPVPGLDPSNFQGRVTLVNVWASWCIPCRTEHPQLERLATDHRFQLVGINYKDSAENARRFLGRYGNPYVAVGVDLGGRAGIEWGVYGVPETFLIGRDGRILYKHVGPIIEENLQLVQREIEKALAGLN